jgi:proline iminopeptidase
MNIKIKWLALCLLVFQCSLDPNLEEQEGYISTKNGNIWYRVLGQGKQTPILTIHGGPGASSLTLFPIKELS